MKKTVYGLGKKTVNKGFLLFFTETDETIITFEPIKALVNIGKNSCFCDFCYY